MDTIFLFMAALTAFCIAAVLFAPVVLRPSAEMRRILVVAARSALTSDASGNENWWSGTC